jgi:DNA repair exonuclease SbcCD ATPase subunit
MIVKSIKISNILSIEDAYVEFDDRGLMLVQGWNHDVGRANGAGKTAIFNALSFALYDKLPRKVTATEILRRGSKVGYVDICLMVGGDTYSIRRSRPKGVTFKKGDDTLNITQVRWEQLLGLSYEQFLLSMYAAQGGANRFLSVNDADKKQFLLQLLNLEEFSSCKKVADIKVKLLDAQQTALQAKRQTIDALIDDNQERLVDETVIQYAVNKCNEAIADLSRVLIDTQQVPRPDLSKYTKLEDDIAIKRTEFAQAKAKREMLHDVIRKLDVKLGTTSTYGERCRSCGSIIDTSSAKAAHEREMEQLSTERDQAVREIAILDDVLSRERGVVEVSRKIRERKVEESAEYESARLCVSDVQSKITLQHRELKELNLKLQNNSNLQSKIKDLVEDREKQALAEELILREIELYKTISAMYSPTGAQAYILDSVIDSFNDRVSEYVSFLWSNMTYELKSYKETVKGDVTAKFSEHLMMDGKPVSIGSLSGGEFRALSLCVDFALVDVMERQFGIFLSPIILDEPFDGLDGPGREFIIELLEKFGSNRQVVVIDHASEVKSMFSKVISVEKKSGISVVSLQL